MHREAWRMYRRLPRLAQIWIPLAVAGLFVELAPLSGAGREASVREAVAAALREVTGPDPASSCAALSPAGLDEVVAQFGEGVSAGIEPLQACRELVPRLRARASAQQLADIAHGSVRAVRFSGGGSALVVFLAADGRLGAELQMSVHGGRWLIDGVGAGAVAGAP